MAARKYRIQVFEGEDGHWRYRLRAPNGRVMQSAEAYVTLANARRAADRLASILNVAHVVEVLPRE
jgi:uncharacterized protein YegP (UPF0339 family)